MFSSAVSDTTIVPKLPVELIMRFVIPVVFYEITNAECVYSSKTTILIVTDATYYCALYILYFSVITQHT